MLCSPVLGGPELKVRVGQEEFLAVKEVCRVASADYLYVPYHQK